MGYLAAYNTSSFSGSLDGGPINIAISSSIFSGSTGAIRFGDIPFPPSGGMTIISDSNTQLGVASASATPLFWSVNSLTDTASVLNTINALPERVTKTRFTTTSSAYLYLVSSSKYFPILGTQPLNTPVTDGLVLYLNAGQLVSYPTTASTWYDISGNSNNGTLINGPTFDSGNGGSIVFDGTDDNVIVPTNSNLELTNDLTINLWVYSISPKSGLGIVCKGPLVNDYDYMVYISANSTTVNFYKKDSTGTSEARGGFNLTLLNKWVNICYTKNGTTVKGYENGVLRATNNFTNSIIRTSSQPLNIGSGWSATLDGKISSVQIYNRALSQTEVLQNYYQSPIVTNGLVFATDAGNLVSYESGSTTTYSLTGSLSGSLVNGVGYLPNNGGTWDFDGTDDYLNFSAPSALNFTSSNAFSTEAWINWDGGAQPNNAGHIIGKTFGNYRTFFLNNTNPGTITFRLGLNTLTCDTPSIISANTWYHVVSTFNPSTFTSKVYVNGVERASNTNVNINWSSTSGNFQIGNSPGENYYFNGKITNGRVYNKTLTPEEVSQNFNAQRSRFGI
jgi:hypothetical protein